MADITYLTLIERESADGSTAVLKDYTSYGVDSVPDRNALALWIKFSKRSAQSVDNPVTMDNNTPVTVTEWTFNLAGGGWYYATIYGFPVYAAGTYNENNAVHYATNGRYYRCKADGVVSIPTVSADWEDITADPTVIEGYEDTNVAINNTHNFTTYDAEIPVSDVLEDLADQITDSNPKDWEDTTTALLGLALLNGAWVKHYRVKNAEGQVIIDFINQKYPSLI